MRTFTSDGGPTIEVWYGDEQQFGNIGIPQTWVNILGNVFDPDGITSLTYSLNDSPLIDLSIGPDDLRLDRIGDFNADLAFADLDGSPTDDELVITATDSLGNVTSATVFIDYESDNTWPQPYTIDWSSVTDIQSVAQVVDGKWAVEEDTVRTLEPGYDRLVAIGETSWDNYEVTSTITINDIPSDIDNGIGFIVGWTGHTDDGNQPKSDFRPFGAIAWYRSGALRITSNSGGNTFADTPITLQEGDSYVFKLRSERTKNNTRTLYSFKVWEEGQPEPDDWTIQKELGSGNQQGSIGLLSHRYDASFSDVSVTPITGTHNKAPVAKDDSGSVAPGSTVEIDVLSNDSDSDGTLVPESLSITTQPSNGTVIVDSNGLVSYTHDGSTTTSDSFSYTVEDDDGATSNIATVNLTIAEPSGSAFESDDFNSTTLDSRWTVIDPLGDSLVGTSGVGTGDALLELSVLGGTAHDLWNNNKDVVRVMQTATDTDFELEVKFASEPDQKFELQGILVEQDNNDWIRFDTYHDGTFLRVFAATTANGNSQSRIKEITAAGSANYLQVNRQEDQWRLDYSGDGSNWTTAGSFTHDLNVSQVGTFAGNSGDSPDFTAEVDYFFNTAEPIVPEDGGEEPAANEAPVANNDSGTVAPAGTVELDVLSNDSDSDGALVPESLSITTQPSNGTVIVDSNGLVSYTHDGSTTTSDTFSYTVEDDDGATSNIATVDLTIAEPSGSAFESDDFNSTTLDSRWTVIDPLGDSLVGTSGVGTGDALLELSVPGGTAHNLWNNNKDAVRVMQTATDTDFELEVKHASVPDQKFELQGILVEQDNNDWIRFDTFSDNNFLRIFAATTTDGNSNQRINTNVAPGSADYLRVNRQEDQWRLDYSGDGSNWTTAGSFTHDLNVSQVGTFAGNSGDSPAFTAEVDYFFNTAEPIVPEI